MVGFLSSLIRLMNWGIETESRCPITIIFKVYNNTVLLNLEFWSPPCMKIIGLSVFFNLEEQYI